MRHIRESGVSHPRGTVDKPMKYMLFALAVMVVALSIRSMYRTVELSNGWTGKVISTEWLFSASSHLHIHAWEDRSADIIEQTRLRVE